MSSSLSVGKPQGELGTIQCHANAYAENTTTAIGGLIGATYSHAEGSWSAYVEVDTDPTYDGSPIQLVFWEQVSYTSSLDNPTGDHSNTEAGILAQIYADIRGLTVTTPGGLQNQTISHWKFSTGSGASDQDGPPVIATGAYPLQIIQVFGNAQADAHTEVYSDSVNSLYSHVPAFLTERGTADLTVHFYASSPTPGVFLRVVGTGITGTDPSALPKANDDTYSTAEDMPLPVPAPGVLGNDSPGSGGGSLTAALVSGPSHGTLDLHSDGSFTYTPTANYNGPDQFTYKANNGFADSNPATVRITVNPVNDPPVADPRSHNVSFNTATPITLTGSDVDGDALTFRVTAQPLHGSLTGTAPDLTYTPAAGYSGPDGFAFVANDGTVDSAPATVSITVGAAPPPANHPPVAVNDPKAVLPKNQNSVTVAVLDNDSDPDGDPLKIISVTQGAYGTVEIQSVPGPYKVRYTPRSPRQKAGAKDAFTYTISDGKGGTASATVTVTYK
jgi:hypothetical protein